MKTIAFSAGCFFAFLYSFPQSPQILVPFRSGNKWGYSDTLGKIKIKPQYDTVSLFDYDMIYKGNHVIAEVKLNRKPMMINEKGSVMVPPKYDYVKLIDALEEPTFIISKANKFGLFGKGKELFPPVSEWLAESYPGLYEIRINGKSGLIDNKGEKLIPAIYDFISQRGTQESGFIKYQCFTEGKAPEVIKIKTPVNKWLSQRVPGTDVLEYISNDNITTIIDSAVKAFGLDSVHLKNNNAALIYKGSTKGIILTDAGKRIYFFSKPYNISHIKYFAPWSRNVWNNNSTAYIIASFQNKYGIINEREEIVLPFQYDGIEEIDELFLLKTNSKIGFFIWNTVHPVIQPDYDKYLGKQYIPVNNGWEFTLFKITKNGKVGFVGENGVPYFKD